jgi:hypothetical protein
MTWPPAVVGVRPVRPSRCHARYSVISTLYVSIARRAWWSGQHASPNARNAPPNPRFNLQRAETRTVVTRSGKGLRGGLPPTAAMASSSGTGACPDTTRQTSEGLVGRALTEDRRSLVGAPGCRPRSGQVRRASDAELLHPASKRVRMKAEGFGRVPCSVDLPAEPSNWWSAETVSPSMRLAPAGWQRSRMCAWARGA